MNEDERLELLRTATEAYADLKDLALRLRQVSAAAAGPARPSIFTAATADRLPKQVG